MTPEEEQALLERARQYLKDAHRTATTTATEYSLDTLISELLSLCESRGRDAERYRWLRAPQNVHHEAWKIVIDPDASPRQMDEVIDAAIAGKG